MKNCQKEVERIMGQVFLGGPWQRFSSHPPAWTPLERGGAVLLVFLIILLCPHSVIPGGFCILVDAPPSKFKILDEGGQEMELAPQAT